MTPILLVRKLMPGSTLVAVALLSACAMAEGGAPTENATDNLPPLADSDVLLSGAPKADDIGREFKADEILPAVYDELATLQSPVRNQGRRGVCSIFATVGLMEHLYLLEGSLADPDFSEQYLQWSAKFEVGGFPHTSGSTASINLRAINQFGIVKEDAWPYEPSPWTAADDSACEGEDNLPTRCYTNGEPSAEVLAAPKFKLPPSRWLNPLDIKAHMFNRGTAVVVGFDFFFQAWNHGRSKLPTNAAYWREGVVLYPNAKDKEVSLEHRAGHAILLVGWDDNLERQIVDAEGNLVVDENGDPVTERGFYIFKNSWGTGSFGVDNPYGPGYGYISQRYIHEYGSVRISDVPVVDLPEPVAEVCDDGIDNDENGATDCDDSACTMVPACTETGGDELVFSGPGDLAIPDNDPVGVASEIHIAGSATIAGLAIDVDIHHTYRGDLRVTLHHNGQAVVLADRTGGSADDLAETYQVEDWNGQDMTGDWKLVVVDLAARDTGNLTGFDLRVTPAK